MKSADVIIGANFGDEGKGLITDFFAARAGGDSVVVRYNGGAQAGHTVVTPEGVRHVFSHFSSGSFCGADTFLSRFFVCNPLLFMKERRLLQEKSAVPRVFVDGMSMVTTPYDMMINQIVEDARGNGRHGSCGLGFGETIERHVSSPHGLAYADLFDTAALKARLNVIRKEWVPARLRALGIENISDAWRERISSDATLEKFAEDTADFLQMTSLAKPSYLADTRQKIVFEGAQGLLLDQERGWFPHVTRSYTGLRNVLSLAEGAGVEALNVAYITRAYATRHGAGPLPHELERAPYVGIRDETNVTNAYQGSLRFGWLDTDLLAISIRNDLSDNKSAIKVKHGLAVTCLDQVDQDVTFMKDKTARTLSREAFLDGLSRNINVTFLLTSAAASREKIEFLQKP